MGIRIDSKNSSYTVSYTERDKSTGKTINRTRRCFVDEDGLKQTIKTKSEAKRVYRKLILEVKEALKRSVVPSWRTLLIEFENYYMNTGVSKKTVETYLTCLNKHTKNWLEVGCENINGFMIKELIQSLDHKSDNHQKNILKFIRAVFEYAVLKNYILKNPTPKMKFKFKSKNLKFLNLTQVQQLLFLAKKHENKWYHHWLLGLYTGMRNGELYALKWHNVDFHEEKIHIKCAWNNKDGFKTTKSGDERIVPISKDIVEELKQLKLLQGSDPFVLPRLSKWTKGEQARELRKFLISFGLPEIRFHDLRSIWATNLLSSGVAPATVMEMGGWKDLKTMQIYCRRAGINLTGATDNLQFMPQKTSSNEVIELHKTATFN